MLGHGDMGIWGARRCVRCGESTQFVGLGSMGDVGDMVQQLTAIVQLHGEHTGALDSEFACRHLFCSVGSC